MKTVLWWLYCAMLGFGVLSAMASWWPMDRLPWLGIFPAFDGVVLIAAVLVSPIVIWAKANPRWPAVAVVWMVILFGFRHAPTGAVDPCSEDSRLKIMTLNVQQFGNDTARVQRIVELIRTSDPDVVCLQEFGLYYKWPDVASVASDFALRIDMPHAEFSPHHGNIFGTAIFSKHRILQCDTVFQELSRTNEAKIYRIQVAEEELTVANVHLESYNLNNADADSTDMASIVEQRLWQARLLRFALQDHPGPIVLLGDFNAAPGARGHKMLSQDFNDLQRAAGKGWMPTHKWLPARIDHVLVSPDVCLKRLNVNGSFPSDHRAIEAEIGW